MKKKILSTLLAVCLFVGVAIPSVFAYTSDLAGNAHRVTKITADAKSYDIKVGESINFADKISVFENGQKLVVDLNQIIYSATGDTNKFNVDQGVVTAVETGGKITLTIYDDENNLARTEVTVNSIPGTAPDGNYATSYVFSKADRYDVVYDDGVLNKDTDFKFEIEAIPTGTLFSTTNAVAITDKVIAEMNAKLGLTDYINQPIVGVAGAKNFASFTVDMTNIITNVVDGKKVLIGMNPTGGTARVEVVAGIDGDYGNVAGVANDMNTPAKAMAKIKRALLDGRNVGLTFVIEGVNYKYDTTATAAAGENKLSFVQIGEYTNDVITKEGIALAFGNDMDLVNTLEKVVVDVTTAPAAATDSITLDGVTVPFAGYKASAPVTPGTRASFVVTITNAAADANSSVATLTIDGVTVTADLAASDTAAAIGAAFNGKKITIGGVTYTAAATTATITFTADTTATVVTPPATTVITDITAFPALAASGTAPVTAPTNGTADVPAVVGVNDTVVNAAAYFASEYNKLTNKAYTASSDVAGRITLTAKAYGNQTPDVVTPTASGAVTIANFAITQGAGKNPSAPIANALTANEVTAITQPSSVGTKVYRGVQVVAGGNGETTKIEFRVDRDELNFVTLAKTPGFNKNIPANIPYQMVRQNGAAGLNVTARTTLYPVKAIPITSVGFANTATLKVGEFKEFAISKYPSNANVGFAGGIEFSTLARRDVNSNDKYQHAIIWTEDGTLKGSDKTTVKVRGINSEKVGVSTGKVDSVTTLRATVNTVDKDGKAKTSTHDCAITVVDQDWKDVAVNTPEISAKSATIKVGGQVVLSVKNTPVGSTVKWSIDNANVSVDPATGLATTVRGKKVGNTVVTATLTNPNTSKTEVYTCNITVLAADAVVTPPTTTPNQPSKNPQTGDTLFANIG